MEIWEPKPPGTLSGPVTGLLFIRYFIIYSVEGWNELELYMYCCALPAWHYRETFTWSLLILFDWHWTNYTFCFPKAFFEQDKDFSYEEKENLLKQTVALEEYMQQGIPVVSRFLAEYLPRWDGEDFQETLFHLLQWVTFSSYLGKSNLNS